MSLFSIPLPSGRQTSFEKWLHTRVDLIARGSWYLAHTDTKHSGYLGHCNLKIVKYSLKFKPLLDLCNLHWLFNFCWLKKGALIRSFYALDRYPFSYVAQKFPAALLSSPLWTMLTEHRPLRISLDLFSFRTEWGPLSIRFTESTPPLVFY